MLLDWIAQTLIVKLVILEVVTLKIIYPPLYSPVFHNVSLWEKVFLGHSASREDVITQFSHYENFPQSLAPLLGPCINDSSSPTFLFFLFTGRQKLNHHPLCEFIIIMLFIHWQVRWRVMSENGGAQLQK